MSPDEQIIEAMSVLKSRLADNARFSWSDVVDLKILEVAFMDEPHYESGHGQDRALQIAHKVLANA